MASSHGLPPQSGQAEGGPATRVAMLRRGSGNPPAWVSSIPQAGEVFGGRSPATEAG
jgi:hypothetical protein